MSIFSKEASFDRALSRNKLRLPLTRRTKVVIFSDLHRGIADWADDFMHNHLIFETALDHYYRRRFTYIELGDGDELVENRTLAEIVDTYGRIFRLMDRFHKAKRFYYIFGNHNYQMMDREWVARSLEGARVHIPGLFQGLETHETLFLGDKLFLFHGHQGDFFSTFLAPLSRFFVRNIWRFIQASLGFKNPMSVAQNSKKRNNLERAVYAWAKKNKLIAVLGHTHKPVFYSLSRQQKEMGLKGKPYTFNSGSGVHPRSISCLEIQDMTIALVKWSVVSDPRDKGRLKVVRQPIESCRKSLLQLFSEL